MKELLSKIIKIQELVLGKDSMSLSVDINKDHINVFLHKNIDIIFSWSFYEKDNLTNKKIKELKTIICKK